MRDSRAWSAVLAGWAVFSFSLTTEAAVYSTPTRQKQAAQNQAAKPQAKSAAQARTTARPVAPARQPAQVTPAQLAKLPRDNRRPQPPIRKSNEMLALEALERMPVPEAPSRARAPAAKPTTPQRSADAIALDALMQN